jgi:hypothetical protein
MKATDTYLEYYKPAWIRKMFNFSYDWIRRNFKFSEIFILLFLVMTTLFMIPWNVWGDEIYAYRDKDDTIVLTNIYPQENVNFNTWNRNLYQDSTPTDKDGNMVRTNKPPQAKISPTTRSSNSYHYATSEERLHWGRDNALIGVQKLRYGQRKTVKDGNGMDAGRYEVNIKKIASNLYQDISTRIIIKTRSCVELAGRDGSSLDWSGVSGELFFINTNKTCIVKKVYN